MNTYPAPTGEFNTSDFLAPNHLSRYLARFAFLGILLGYILNITPVNDQPIAVPWILAIGGIYAGGLLILWVISLSLPRSDFSFLGVLLLDMTALSLALPYDPMPSCPAMFAMVLMVLDNGFRREGYFYVSCLICAALVGSAVVVLRHWIFGPTFAMASAWTLVFVMFLSGYGYYLFKAFFSIRSKLQAVFQLADASDDFIFAVGGPHLQLSNGNRAIRDTAPDGASLIDVFETNATQMHNFAQEVRQNGSAVRSWTLRGSDRKIEVKGRSMPGQERIACIGRDMSMHLKRAEQLLLQSNSDALTGLHNRRSLDHRLTSEWRRMARMEQKLAVLMIDIDWFKNYNDTFGHQAGDECLQSIAKLLRVNMLRAGDFIARYGGEEFTMIAPECDEEGAQIIAQRLINLVAGEAMPHPSSPFGYITISIGAAAVQPIRGQDPDELVHIADEALYNAKQHGRNRVVVAEG